MLWTGVRRYRTELLERRAKLMAGKKWHKREMDELCRKEEEEMRQWRKEERLKVSPTYDPHAHACHLPIK